ncbi:MAG: sorbosone dehydrogenase family protein, partial [Nitrosomonadaceae bacterium]
MTRAASIVFLVLSFHGLGISQAVPQDFSLLTINSGLDGDATGFALLPDNRIFVVHQFRGQVKLIVNGVLNSEELLTVPDLQTSSEKGLLGIAVDPDFPNQPYIYLFHSHNSSTNRVSRFTIEGELQDPTSDNLTIDVDSQLTLVDDMPANAGNHNGGTLRFGSDQTLYISHGDDANSSLVQDLTTLNGKILRINRDGTIPSDNPSFPSEPPGKRSELFCFGLRNPFRFSIDPSTDELFIGDVGSSSREEFDVSTGGENFGWPRYEGTDDRQTGANLIQPDPTFPIWEYSRLPGSNSGIALVTYRQKNYPSDASFPPEYDGTYFYADFYHDWIRNIRPDGSGGWMSVDFGNGFSSPVDGAIGADGSLYLLEYGQALLQIVYNPVVPPVSVETEDPIIPDEFIVHQNF